MNKNVPVNCGATVPRVNLSNFIDDKIAGVYCSRIGSTLALINSDAAYTIIGKRYKNASPLIYIYILKPN